MWSVLSTALSSSVSERGSLALVMTPVELGITLIHHGPHASIQTIQ